MAGAGVARPSSSARMEASTSQARPPTPVSIPPRNFITNSPAASPLESSQARIAGLVLPEVSGLLKYRTNAKYPHEVAVDAIEPYPPEHELPELSDLRGRAPDATGAMSVEEFIDGLRDGWR